MILANGPAPSEGSGLTAEALQTQNVLQVVPGRVRLSIQEEAFDIESADIPSSAPLAAVVIFDELTPDRLRALGRFWTAVTGKPVPADPRMTKQRRLRARQMLRAVDAKADGATYRAIAGDLFPQHDSNPESWVGTAIRETTIRLVRDGQNLVRGGYRSLLRRPRRDR
ncbi:MAG: DUF2285 domain-containing protein [Sphingomonadaceae bacterium]